MKKEDAIKYLQQLYPNGGHCWLDEQRMKAIGMAVQALQEKPASEDIWEASKKYALRQALASTDAEMSEQAYLDLRLFSGLELAIAHKDGAKWQEAKDQSTIELAEDHAMLAGMDKMREKMMKDAVDGIVGYYNQRGLSISMNLPKDLEENDKVKLIIIKQHKLS